MVIIPNFMGFHTFQLVQDFVHEQYASFFFHSIPCASVGKLHQNLPPQHATDGLGCVAGNCATSWWLEAAR